MSLSLSPRHLQGLLTGLAKRAFASTATEIEESAGFTNEALILSLQFWKELSCT